MILLEKVFFCFCFLFFGFMFFSFLSRFLKGLDINESFSALFYLLFIHCNFFFGLL